MVSVAADLAEVLELDLMLLHVATPEPTLTVAVSPHHHVREADIEGAKANGKLLLADVAARLELSHAVSCLVRVGEASLSPTR